MPGYAKLWLIKKSTILSEASYTKLCQVMVRTYLVQFRNYVKCPKNPVITYIPRFNR